MAASTRRRRDYNSLGAQIALQPFRSHPGVEFALSGQNLTNDVQCYATAFNKNFVAMLGTKRGAPERAAPISVAQQVPGA